jgi:hypothetical protein
MNTSLNTSIEPQFLTIDGLRIRCCDSGGSREQTDHRDHRDQRDLNDKHGVPREPCGPRADAVKHTREPIDMWEGCRGMIKDSDVDPIRQPPLFPARRREFGRA